MKKDSRLLSDDQIARRISLEIKDGSYVNLGAGAIPFMVSQFCPVPTMFHIELGILGAGKVAQGADADQDLIGIGRRPILAVPGASCSSSAEAFAMLRGKHFDMAILGALQVSEKGDLANWLRPKFVPQVGGAMDIAPNVGKLLIAMDHVTKYGEPKIVKNCNLPITARKVVKLIFTDMAVIEVTENGLLLKEVAPGFSVEEVQRATEPELKVSDRLCEIRCE